MRGTHHSLVENRHIHVQLVERDILLRIGAYQIVKLKAGDCPVDRPFFFAS